MHMLSRRPEVRHAGRGRPPSRAPARPGAALVAGVALVAGIALPGHPAAAQAAGAAAVAGADLYVSNEAGSGCSDSGSGTASQPFCTITAAAAAVQPGQTVIVEPGNYDDVTISRSGTSSAPITFLAANSPAGLVSVGVTQQAAQDAFLVSGAHDVVISGFNSYGSGAILVDNSAGITINGGAAHGLRAPAIRVTGTSSNVTISRVAIAALSGHGVQIDPGVTGTVVTTSNFAGSPDPGVVVTDAPGTVITSNTLVSHCATAITVAGTSPGATVENNIVETASGQSGAPACADPAAATGVSVSAASTPRTVADYNLIDPASGGALYGWGAVSYSTLASFTAGTGQGAHDIAASPGLGSATTGNVTWYPLTATSPAVDSADAGAPGELATDLLGNPRADDPAVPNTGTGPGYHDRGAVELEGPVSYGSLTVTRDPASGPLDVTAASQVTTSWTADGPIGTNAFYFSDSTLPVLTTASSVLHSFRTAGERSVEVVQSANGFLGGGTGSQSARVVVGADYTPVAPVRILDTRDGTGVTASGPVAAGADLVLPIASIGQVSAADISAVVANVTVTRPTAAGTLTVYSQPGAGTATSNINFSAHQTVPNLVTVQLAGGVIRFHNASSGTVQVIADLEGYYGAGGSGFKPLSPVRVLDTRNGTGAPAATPVAAHGRLVLDLSGKLPAGAAAAVLNVTVTAPATAGFLTAYPDGQPVPDASNLNFSAGETVPNLVVVPLSGDKADFYNGSGGTVQVVADLNGYFASGATGTFVPDGPARIVDTHNSLGVAAAGAVAAHGTLTFYPSTYSGCVPGCPAGTAAVLNVTVTQPKAGGYLTVYPDGQGRPGSSSLNFLAGRTVPNLVCVQDVNGAIDIYNASGGTVQVVVDEEGYYIGPP
jgi:Right handed beta helix region